MYYIKGSSGVMKKVYLYAYDKTNLGDDLFIETIVNRYPNTLFYMMSDVQNKNKFKRLKNLRIINKNSQFVTLLKRIRPSLVARYEAFYKNRCDAHVYIGGSIFMEYPTWKNIVNWWNYQADHYYFYVLGANFGPYTTEEYKEEMKEVFAKLKDVCFRDKYSYNLFSDVDTVRYAPDILFGYDKMPKAREVKKQIFMSLIDCNSKEDERLRRNSENYIEKMAEIADSYMRDGYKVLFVSFCKAENDMVAIQQVCDKLSHWQENRNYSVLEYDGYNSQEILLEIVESEYIVASRFHAVILGILAGKPVLPVIYSDKTKNVLNDISINSTYLDIRKITDNIENDYMNVSSDVIEVIKIKAENHFVKLDCTKDSCVRSNKGY